MRIYVKDEVANKHINQISSLVAMGYSDLDIAVKMTERGYKNLASADGEWGSGNIKEIRGSFRLGMRDSAPLGRVFVKTYNGQQKQVAAGFQSDALKMAAHNYFPTTQTWTPGEYSVGNFIVALLLCFLLVGLFVFIYMLIVKPDGVLTVTYELRSESEGVESGRGGEKICPKCAEQIKAAAIVCRFCGHKFA